MTFNPLTSTNPATLSDFRSAMGSAALKADDVADIQDKMWAFNVQPGMRMEFDVAAKNKQVVTAKGHAPRTLKVG